jgi:hypothetical protein
MPKLVSELALDDNQRDAFTGHLDGVGVSELVRREAAAHARRGGGAAQFGACRSGRHATAISRLLGTAVTGRPACSESVPALVGLLCVAQLALGLLEPPARLVRRRAG